MREPRPSSRPAGRFHTTLAVTLAAIAVLAIALPVTAPVTARWWLIGGALVFPTAVALVAVALAGLAVLIAVRMRGPRSRVARAIALSALALTTVVLLSSVVTTPPVAPLAEIPRDSQDGEFRALAWNVERQDTDPALLADVIDASGADATALIEISMTDEQAAELEDRLGGPIQVLAAPNHPMRLIIDSSWGEYAVTTSDQSGAWSGFVAEPVDPQSTAPRLVAVHVVRMFPVPGGADLWNFGLEWVAQQCSEPNTIAFGDVNADTINMPNGRLGGCIAPTPSADVGLAPTWPASVPPSLGGRIDHVLATDDWQATWARTLEVPGALSDHRPVLSILRPGSD